MNQETENKNNTQITEGFLSLEKILASKNKSLVKFMPKFLLNRFKKLVHLDEINSANKIIFSTKKEDLKIDDYIKSLGKAIPEISKSLEDNLKTL